jgi:hypothetical protein
MNHNDKLTGRLNELESHLQSMVEGSLMRLFTRGKRQHTELAPQLVAALQAGCKSLEDGRILAPNLFLLATRDGQLNGTEHQDEFLDELASHVAQAGEQAGFIFLEDVQVRLLKDESVPLFQVGITAQIAMQHLAATTDMESDAETGYSEMPENAFLIIDGVRIFSLEKPVINIGRRPDNQLVIDDPRISRSHAQLRAIQGRFVIFDLASTGGTQVNGQKINQAVLFAGDVISLAGLPVVYGQEEKPMKETQKLEFSDDNDGPPEVIA